MPLSLPFCPSQVTESHPQLLLLLLDVAISGTSWLFFLHNPPKGQFIHSLSWGKAMAVTRHSLVTNGPWHWSKWIPLRYRDTQCFPLTYFHYNWRRKHSPANKMKYNKTKPKRHLRSSLSWRLERDTIGYRKKLNEQITRQIFINHVVYLGAQDTQ